MNVQPTNPTVKVVPIFPISINYAPNDGGNSAEVSI